MQLKRLALILLLAATAGDAQTFKPFRFAAQPAGCDPCSPTFFTQNTTDFNSNTYATLLAANQIVDVGTEDRIDSGNPTANYWGGCDALRVGLAYRGIVSFDLTQIPSTATVTAVEFWIRGVGWNTTDDTLVYRLTSGPISTADDGGTCEVTNDADAVDWNDYAGSSTWTTAGGDYSATLLTTFDCASDITDVWIQGGNSATCGGGSDDCLVEAVQGMIDGTYQNYGFILIGSPTLANTWAGEFRTDGLRLYMKVTWS